MRFGGNMTDITKLATEVHTITPQSSIDEVAETVMKLDGLMERAKELKQQLEGAMLEWLQVHGELVIGDTKYVIGNKKSTKCMNIPAAVEACLNSCDGDFELFCRLLGSNALKYGACRQVLPEEEYARHFVTTVEQTLEGKPVKQVLKLDTRFVR